MRTDRIATATWGFLLHKTQTQGRDVADIVDGLRLSLRQAKDAITVRDEETRRLRSAVKHLEGALSLRERELRDTVRRVYLHDVPAAASQPESCKPETPTADPAS